MVDGKPYPVPGGDGVAGERSITFNVGISWPITVTLDARQRQLPLTDPEIKVILLENLLDHPVISNHFPAWREPDPPGPDDALVRYLEVTFLEYVDE